MDKIIIDFTLDDHIAVLNQGTQHVDTIYRIQSPSSSLGVFSVKGGPDFTTSVSHRPPPSKDPVFMNAYKPHMREIDFFSDGSFNWFLFFQDRAKDMNEDIYFGFISIDNMREWFNEQELIQMHEAGFTLNVIEVTQSWASSNQVIFFKNNIISTQENSILDYI